MSRRYVNRPDSFASTQSDPDLPPFESKRSPTPSWSGNGGVLPDQDALGAADRGDIEPEPEVTGEAEMARVSESLAIAQQQIRSRSE